MSDTIKNAKQLPKIYYGLHFVDGLAGYDEPGKEPLKVFLNDRTITEMDQTFQGCPVYVHHVDEVDLGRIAEADGYVVRSFRNEVDGKHWAEFLVVSDKGHEAIKRGWKLSNAYVAESFGPSGTWNGIDYQKEITKGRFEHLAIVPAPRYAESIVLDLSQFREYNEHLKLTQTRVSNSHSTAHDGKKIDSMSILKIFKKTPVSDTTEFEDAIVTLPSGTETSLKDLVKNAAAQEADTMKKTAEAKKENSDTEEHAEHKAADDKSGKKTSPEEAEKQGKKPEESGAAPQMANMEHHVMVNGESKPLQDVMTHYNEMHQCMTTLSKHMANDKQVDGGEEDAAAAKVADLTKTNADTDGGEDEADAQLKESDKTHRNSETKIHKNFEKLANAHLQVMKPQNVDSLSQADRGRSRYGSK